MAERTRVLAATSAALLLSVLVWFNYSAVLPIIVAEWGLSGFRAGVVFSAFQAGYLLAIVPMGWLADRRSPRWVIAIGATGAGAFSLAFALFATGFRSGTALRFFAGLGMAGVYVPGMRFVSDWYPPAARGRAMGAYVGTFAIGSGLSVLVATAVADAVGWRAAIGATSVGALAVAPLILAFTRDNPARTADDSGFDLGVVRNRAYLCAVSAYSWHNWELFGARNWLLAFLLATPAFAAGSSALAGTVVGIVIAMSGVGNVVGGWLSDRIGRSRAIALGLGTSAVCSAVLGVLGWLPRWALVLALLVYGVVLSVDSAPTSTLVTEVVADERIGTALSIQSFVGFSTTVVSPIVFGVALDTGGYALAFPTLAAGAVLGLASVGALVSRVDRSAASDDQTNRS